MQQRFLLQILLLAQHVSGIAMPIIRSSRVLYSGCCLWYFVLWFSSCWSGVELRVMCPVCRMLQHPEFQFYWYCDSTCFGQPFCPSSGVLSHTLVHFMQIWWPFATMSRMELKNLHKMYQCRCTAKNSWWAERLPETCRGVIPIKLEFSASVGFIHKELDWLSIPNSPASSLPAAWPCTTFQTVFGACTRSICGSSLQGFA